MRTRFALSGCALLLAACPPRSPATLAPVLAAARVYYADGPAFRDSTRLVVRDVTAWQAVWTQATSTQPPAPPMPAVDFGREMVLVVAGGHMTAGDQIHVDSVGVRGGYFVAVVRTVECPPFPAAVYPLEIVRVRRSDKPATFIEHRERATSC